MRIRKLLNVLLLMTFLKIPVLGTDTIRVYKKENHSNLFQRYKLSPKKNLIDGTAALLFTGAAFTASYLYFDQKIHNEVVSAALPDKVLPVLNIFEPMGRGRTSHFAMGTFLLAGALSKDRKLIKTSVVWLVAFGMSDFAVRIGKNGFQRYRPNTGYPAHTFGERQEGNNNSLPSQHAANAFVAATVISTMYKDRKWVAPVAYTSAALVGLQRITRQAHWTSDVIAGAAIGFISAKTIIWLSNYLEKKNYFIFPKIGNNEYSLGCVFLIN